MLNNIQFNEKIDSSAGYETIDDWVDDGLKQFVTMQGVIIPEQFKGKDRNQAIAKAFINCANKLRGEAEPKRDTYQTLDQWFEDGVKEFITIVYAAIPARFMPDDEQDAQEYVYLKLETHLRKIAESYLSVV